MSVTSSSADSAAPSHELLRETAEDLWSTLLLDNIPQLDGSTDPPRASRRRVRKTLGVKRRRGQLSLHAHRPPNSSPKSTLDTLSEGDTFPSGSAATGSESSDGEGTRVTASKKARPSLSLKKKLSVRSCANQAVKDEPICLTSFSLNTHPLVDVLKKQALTNSFRPHVKKLALSQAATECLRKAKKAPTSTSSGTIKGGEQLQRRKRRASKGGGRSSVVPPGWSKHLRSRSVGEREELLKLEWTTELEKYSYVQQLQAALEESLKSPDGSVTESTTDTDTAGDTSRPLTGGEANSSAEGEEHHSSHEMNSQPGLAVFQADVVQLDYFETSKDQTEVGSTSELPAPFDVEHCKVSPEDLEVTVVESPMSSPAVALGIESGSPKPDPFQKTPPLARGVLPVPLGALSSSPCSDVVEPIPVPEELKSLFDTVPLVDRVVCGVEGEVGIHDVSLTESDFHLALTASDTESEDAMKVDMEGEDVLEGGSDSSQWHSEVEPTSAEKTIGMYLCGWLNKCLGVSWLFTKVLV